MYTHVVGATSSIGSAITARLEEDGHHVVTIGRSNSNNITWDVLNDAYIPDLAQFYPVSGFIFCLGLNYTTMNGSLSRADIDKELVKANVFSAIDYYHTVRPHLEEKPSIVYLGSLATSLIYSDDLAYTVSKSALYGLVRATSFDIGQLGGIVNMVSPGYVKTPMTQQSWQDLHKRAIRSSRTMRNQWASPDQIADVVSFLMKRPLPFISGQNIFVDDGWHLSSGI